MNKSDIIENISKEINIPKSKAKLTLNIMLQCIKESLTAGNKVSIPHFGVFDLKTSKPRKYKNIKTGEICQTKSKYSATFRSSSSINSLLNSKDNQSDKTYNYHYIEDETNYKVFISKPNIDQTGDLKIQYTPIDALVNTEDYPIVLMPQKNSFLKLPRKGRSDVRGHKEAAFDCLLKKSDLPLGISNEEHLSILGRTLPYEPDFVLYDSKVGLYIDVEIDEPYDGYSRRPTHTIDGHDDLRDRFFTESGWVVVRFTEHQIHTNPDGCILLLKHIGEALTKGLNSNLLNCIPHEKKWSARQAILWEKELYRERYLGIQSFSKKAHNVKVICCDKTEIIETKINRTLIHTIPPNETIEHKDSQAKLLPVLFNKTILFDEESHSYFPSSDLTGCSDYISVTTLIEQFFPYFDIDAYIKYKKGNSGNRKIRKRNT